MSRPSLISFITPVCNQGDEARATVANAQEELRDAPHEIIVVDDHSIDGSCHAMPKDVLIVRTDRRDGVSAARRCGFEQSRGDILIWSDPHCRFPRDSLKHLAMLAQKNEAIMQPLNAPNSTARRRHGGLLALSDRGLRVKRAFRRAAEYPALYGTIYAMQRSVYERLGGWPKLPGVWSYSEQALTLMAWFLGVPILVDPTFFCIHKSYHQNKRFPFSVKEDDRVNNAHFVHAVFFPKAYACYWRPMLERRFGTRKFDSQVLESNDFQKLRRHVRRHAVRSEEQFFRDVLCIKPPIDPKESRSDGMIRLHERRTHSSKLLMPQPANSNYDSSASVDEAVRAPSRITYRAEPPSGDAYVRQQAKRSRGGEYRTMRPRIDAALRWAMASLPDRYLEGKSALDAGTRDGYGVVALQAYGAVVASGIELVPEAAAHARRRGRSVRQGDISSLPYDEGTLDLVTCIHTLEHCPNPANVVREFSRVLRPGGWLFVVVPQDERPEADDCHNCAFPNMDSLTGLIAESQQLDPNTFQQSVGILARGKRELRILAMKKTL